MEKLNAEEQEQLKMTLIKAVHENNRKQVFAIVDFWKVESALELAEQRYDNQYQKLRRHIDI